MTESKRPNEGCAPLPPAALRWRCLEQDPSYLEAGSETPAESTLGQDRAVEALQLGLDIDAPGFNVFVAGDSGSGRTFTVRGMLEADKRASRLTEDRVFVHNFQDRDRPRLLRMPSGQAKGFKAAMKELVASLPEVVERTLRDESLVERRRSIIEKHKAEAKSLLAAIDEEIEESGFVAVEVQQGEESFKAIVYSMDDEPVSFDALRHSEEARGKFIQEQARFLRQEGKMLPTEEDEREAVVDEVIEALEARASEIGEEVEEAFKEAQRIERRASKQIKELEQGAIRAAISVDLEELKGNFSSEGVSDHLDAVLDHTVENLHLFRPPEEEEEPDGLVALLGARSGDSEDEQWVYEVNIVQQPSEAAPIVFERHPTFTNLFGTIERKVTRQESSELRNFTMIRPGSMLRADGGFLVLYARDVLLEPGVWRTLVRTLNSRQLEIQPPETSIFLMPSALKPDAVPLNLKVILIGEPEIYHLLSHYESDFKKIFKVKAEFDSSIQHTEENIVGFLDTVRSLVERQKSMPLGPDALAALLEEAVRLAGRRNRVSTQFGQLADIISEAEFWAKQDAQDAQQIDAAAIWRALRARRNRHALADEHLSRLVREEVVLIDCVGEEVGAINGLAVYGLGEHHFGKPSRITAAVGAGTGGVVNIEREARLSGPSHDKGIMILTGYLRRRYGAETPLAFSASIAFEQSYGGVDGDSATLAEVFTLLSALSGLPIRQSVAITGSMNQLGQAQAVGGVNEKIEGFFGICEDHGLTGAQGCIIPKANVESLMLDPSVVEAAAAGKFHVWAVSTIDEAIPLLFGETADALHAKVSDRLSELAKISAPSGERTVEREAAPNPSAPPKPPRVPRPPTPTEEQD